MRPQTAQIAQRLSELCREILARIVLDPDTAILDLEVRIIKTPRFDCDQPRTCYLVRITTSDSSVVSGAVNGFKGSYKERLEGALDVEVRRFDPQAGAAVDIVGPGGPTVERFVAIAALEATNVVSASSPIVRTARAFDIPWILIRGRHLVGPSPAIADALRTLVAEGFAPETVLDLFSGTGIGSIVVARQAPGAAITSVELDETKVRAIEGIRLGNMRVVHGDALTYPFRGLIDLVIADPYYEDALKFLDVRGPDLRRHAKKLVFVGGQVEHQSWNEKIESRLTHYGFDPKPVDLYGQRVYVCS